MRRMIDFRFPSTISEMRLTHLFDFLLNVQGKVRMVSYHNHTFIGQT